MLIDVPKEHTEQIEELVRSKHPKVEFGGLEPNKPMFPEMLGLSAIFGSIIPAAQMQRCADRLTRDRKRKCSFTANARIAHGTAIVRWVVLGAVALMLTACHGGGAHMSFLDPQGPVADAQRWHFYWVLGIMAVLVAAPIFVLTPFWAWRYRYGAKKSRYSPKWSFSRGWELMVWGGPIVIVAILAFFVWRDSHRLDPYKPLASNHPALRVQVIGYDWKWLFIYPDQGIATIGTLAMPVGRPLSMHLTSATVMQSFFIPALGSQIYAMGGMNTQLNLEASKPGRSLGENTMYNGDGFHQQKFTAVAMTPAEFKAWVNKVRAHGIPLDAQALKTISQRSTRTQLIAALPKAKSMDGNVYFTGVSKSLYPAVIKATMGGTPVALAASPQVNTSTSVKVTGKTATPVTEK